MEKAVPQSDLQPRYVPSTVRYDVAKQYGDQVPFEVYNQLAEKVPGMPKLSVSDYNSKRADFMVRMDGLLRMTSSELASTGFVLTLDELTLDLSLCNYASATFSQARAKNASSGDALGVLRTYAQRVDQVCESVLERYQSNGLLQSQEQSQPVEKGE